ncbi:unnamed protein product, partial [Choristocarpus tenellus]
MCCQVIVDMMRKTSVKAGELIIKQGDKGDKFYIINSGKFEVHANQDKERVENVNDIAGILVHVYESTDAVKPCFGHLALLYSRPRSASVLAVTDGDVWELDRPVFRRIM